MADQTQVPGQTQTPNSPPTEPQKPFDWDSVPQTERDAYEARIKHEQYSHIKGRLLGEELRVKNEAELKELVELGRKAKETLTTPSKKSDEPNIEAKQALQAAEDAKRELAEKTSTYANQVMKSSLSAAYLAAGGRDNTTDSNVRDQAINLMIAEGLFEVDSNFNVRSKSDITVAQAMDLWLKRNNHFMKALEAPKGPQPPGPGQVPIQGQKMGSAVLIDKWLSN